MLNERLTGCECTGPGYCSRHKCEKTRYRFEMCRRSAGWYGLWEQGRGPGQQRPVEATAPSRDNCRHLGSQTRMEACPTCCGHVSLKVFACDVHQECTLVMNLPSVIDCATCEDYESRGTRPSP